MLRTPTITAAKAFAISGSSDATGQPIVANLTADMIQISIQRYNSDSQTLAQCDARPPDAICHRAGLAPDTLTVSIPDGYPITAYHSLCRAAANPLQSRCRGALRRNIVRRRSTQSGQATVEYAITLPRSWLR